MKIQDYAPLGRPPASWARNSALFFLVLSVVFFIIGSAELYPIWADADGFYAFAFLFGLACLGSFSAWIQVAVESDGKFVKFLDRWRRILAAEDIQEY